MASSAHVLPPNTESALETLVDQIQANPGAMIDPRDFEEIQGTIDPQAILASLPEGLTEQDFVDILRLAMLTECATELYGGAISERAALFDASWLHRFNERVWIPDELSHATPYRILLRELGYSDDELERQIRQTQEGTFIHRGGDLPVQVTTFGMIQEYFTDNWHGLISKLIRPVAPVASRMISHIKRRETLHTIWYRDMTALQIEGRPDGLPLIATAMAKFEMPGNSLLPDLQAQSTRWLPLLDADFERIGRDLIRLIYEIMGDTRRAAQLLVEIAAEKGQTLGPVPIRHVSRAVNRLGGPGYGLLGEAILEKFGLGKLVQREQVAGRFTVAERIRTVLRSWVVGQLDQRADFAALTR